MNCEIWTSYACVSPTRPKKIQSEPPTPTKRRVQKVRHERSLARDPFKLKMKVKLAPVTLREYEKERRRRSETEVSSSRERSVGEARPRVKRRKMIASNTYCEPCTRSFPTPSALRRHARLAHGGDGSVGGRKRRRVSSSFSDEEDEEEEYEGPSSSKQVKYLT